MTEVSGAIDTAGGLRRPRIALTMGDANGIGPEVLLKALLNSTLRRQFDPVYIGSIAVLRDQASRLNFEMPRLVSIESLARSRRSDAIAAFEPRHDSPLRVNYGAVEADSGRLAMRSVEAAVDYCLSGRMDAVVTAPISKEAIRLGGYDTPGHTGFIAERCNAASYTMMMIAEKLRIGLVTGHIPLSEVSSALSIKGILAHLADIDSSLKRDFGKGNPRIAVLGVNPHAGEAGMLGSEETDLIAPAVREARDLGFSVFGPFASDGFFGSRAYLGFDAVLAMYHDQGLIPFKQMAFDSGVNFTAGIPVVRTSPDHGTAFDIAGTDRASSGSMQSAIALALAIVRSRSEATDNDAQTLS